MKTRTLFSVCLVCLILGSGSAVLAQGGRPSGQRSGEMGRGGPPALPDSTQIVQMVDELERSLSLTASQKEQVSELYFDHFLEVQELMGSEKGDRQEHRKQMEVLRTEFENEVKALLNDEQQAKFDQSRNSRGPRGGRQRQRRE